MLYIKVHKYDADKNPVFIRANQISSFSRDDAHNATVVCEQQGSNWSVSETPDDIITMLKLVCDQVVDEQLSVVTKNGVTHFSETIE